MIAGTVENAFSPDSTVPDVGGCAATHITEQL